MVQSATQKPQSPPPPPPKPAEQPAATPGPAQQQTPAQRAEAARQPAAGTGYAIQDGFETQPRRNVAPSPQGDTFEAARALPARGGAAKEAAPAAVVPQGAGLQGARLGEMLKDPSVVDALMKQARPGKIADPAKAPDPDDPTKGMTPEERAAYDALPPDQRAAYDELHRQAATNTQTRTITSAETIATPDASVDALRKLLTSGRLGDYLAVEKAMGSDQGKEDLRQLLFQGLLPGDRNLKDGRDTLSYLTELADPNTTLLPGIDRGRLLDSLAHDLNHPEQIAQGLDDQDCGATGQAFLLALGDPAEYARIITGLAENGEVDVSPWYTKLLGAFGMGDGEPHVIKLGGDFDVNDGRSPTSQLFGRAFTNDASAGDGFLERIKRMLGLDGGINGTELKDTLNEFDRGWDAVFVPPENDPDYARKKDEAQDVMRKMLENASRDNPVFANVDGHWVCVTGYNSETGEITFFDPFARNQEDRASSIRTEKLDKFMEGDVNSVVYQSGGVPEGVEVPDWMHDDAGAKDGGGGTKGGDYDGAGN